MSRARNLADLLDSNGDVVSGALDSQPQLGRRNLLTNGALEVNQRGFSSRTYQGGTGNGQYTVDRWRIDWSLNGNTLTEIVDDAPSGFNKSMKFTCNTVSTDPMTNSEYQAFVQFIEDRNLQHLAYGTSDAKKVTLSFWVKANHTATYSAGFRANLGGTPKGNHQSYTINSANTWEYKTLTFNPDTTSSFTNDGSAGLQLFLSVTNGGTLDDPTDNGDWDTGNYIGLHSGVSMDHFNDTAGNTIQWAGIQLEVGSVATPFEHRSYGEELALCQRYYQTINNFITFSAPSSNPYAIWTATVFPTQMRTSPSVSLPANIGFEEPYGSSVTATGVTIQQPTNASCCLQFSVGSVAYGAVLRSYPNSGAVNFDAEL